MNVNEFLKATYNEKRFLNPKIYCKDGTSLSVQANALVFCKPQKNNAPHYYEVEVGRVSNSVPSSWDEYGDGCAEYSYVPVEMVDEYISLHGGIDIEKSCKKIN